jgi:2-polyprenyl-6-methoxyphenol hydroxylase-like FAD-dependent oxidoreductase
MPRPEVLIAGAGPTGLALALWLTRLGVPIRIIDRASEPGTTSRALGVQARTLELYRQLDLDREVVGRGVQVPAVNLWARGRRAARLPFATIGEHLTPYPFVEIFPQEEHERLLIERLQQLGVTVERGTELASFSDDGQCVRAQLRGADGRVGSCECAYLAGCDGARSRVRETLAAGFRGGTYRHLFYVADIEGSGPPVNGELHVDLDEADFLAVFPLPGEGRVRLVGIVGDQRAEHADTLQFADVSGQAMSQLRLAVRRVNWFSTYHVHHRVTGRFRGGRAFLLGDAAHIHSPVGAQGMNTGIGDAANLAWKLAAVLAREADAALLDSYEIERGTFARRLVATTDQAFTFVTAAGAFAGFVRTRLAPRLLSAAIRFAPLRRFLFRTVSQISLNYRGMPLSEGVAGRVHGGDRLPWVPQGASDNHAPLKVIAWQVQVYGTAGEELRAACARCGLPLTVFPWTAACRAAGIGRDALYLLRPDTYVALAQRAVDPPALERYFTERALRPRLAPRGAHS